MKTIIKKATLPPKQIEEAKPEPTAEVAVGESVEKQKFRALIAAYAIQNPVKYAQKKADLEIQLNNIK